MENIYLGILLFQFFLSFYFILISGGLLKHIYFSFCLILYFFYLFLSGYSTLNAHKFMEIGVSIEDIFVEGLIFYNIGLAFFIFGYFFRPLGSIKTYFFDDSRQFNDKALVRLTIGFLILNYLIRFIGLGINGSFGTYLFLTQDFLIILTIACYMRKVNTWFYYFTLCSSIFLFSSNFFRYRIILTLVGIGIIYLTRNPDIFKKIGRYFLIALAGLYAILFFTINRQALADNNLGNVTFSLSNDNNVTEIFASEGSNLHTDFSVLKLYRDKYTYPHDFGHTMFIQPIYRALPSFFFPDGIKPYPRSLQIIIDAYGATFAARNSGKAVTNIGEYFIAFGMPGVIILMFLFGYFLKRFQNNWLVDGNFNELTQVAILVSLFQYITRGFFPQYLTHIAYLLAPVLYLRRISKKNYGNPIPSENFKKNLAV